MPLQTTSSSRVLREVEAKLSSLGFLWGRAQCLACLLLKLCDKATPSGSSVFLNLGCPTKLTGILCEYSLLAKENTDHYKVYEKDPILLLIFE